jgi:hypothetical protein
MGNAILLEQKSRPSRRGHILGRRSAISKKMAAEEQIDLAIKINAANSKDQAAREGHIGLAKALTELEGRCKIGFAPGGWALSPCPRIRS